MEVQQQQQQRDYKYVEDPLPIVMWPYNPRLLLPSPSSPPCLDGCVAAKLLNCDLWQKFHRIGTEMIITKHGRRIFPNMRLLLQGLQQESDYYVLLEMVPIGDCRYKFSGSQWVPAGGAEPQSPQRMFLHPDSPASGAHWQAQPILFSKVKLTNNTLDSNGHVVLASMHKYQPRIHIIRTADLAQIPWAPQQAFVFPETEFVAVTAYQNDRITRLKIDNNPFAKGFRDTEQRKSDQQPYAGNADAAPLPSISVHTFEGQGIPPPLTIDDRHTDRVLTRSPAMTRRHPLHSTASAVQTRPMDAVLDFTRSRRDSRQQVPIAIAAGMPIDRAECSQRSSPRPVEALAVGRSPKQRQLRTDDMYEEHTNTYVDVTSLDDDLTTDRANDGDSQGRNNNTVAIRHRANRSFSISAILGGSSDTSPPLRRLPPFNGASHGHSSG